MSKSKLDKLKNTITALLTPFKEDFSLDEEKYREFIRFQIDNGCQLLTMGTTGESATMSHEEHHRAIEITVDEAKQSGKDPLVIAGTGSNSTNEAISLSAYAEKMGADMLLLVLPYYNKPAQHSLIAHFSAIADAVSIPIIIYNIPGRTGVNLEVETLVKIANAKDNIVGIKEASGNIEQITKTIKSLPDDFVVLSGDDNLTYHIMALGGKGVAPLRHEDIPVHRTHGTRRKELRRKWPGRSYHRRPLTETANSMLKRGMGETLRGRTVGMQARHFYMKCFTHNMCLRC